MNEAFVHTLVQQHAWSATPHTATLALLYSNLDIERLSVTSGTIIDATQYYSGTAT